METLYPWTPECQPFLLGDTNISSSCVSNSIESIQSSNGHRVYSDCDLLMPSEETADRYPHPLGPSDCVNMKQPLNQLVQSWGYLKDLYSHTFWDPQSPPDPDKEQDIVDKVVIVTGSNAGIGRETALQLAKRGALVILACRNMDRAQEAKKYIQQNVPNATLTIMELDLGDLSSIRKFASDFEAKYDKLDILVNNAGVMHTDKDRRTTNDGFELQFGVNHLGPLLLTLLLLPSLRKGAPSKIVCISSSLIVLTCLTLEDLMMEKDYYPGLDGTLPYKNSKLANALSMRYLASHLKLDQERIKVFQVCPGFVNTDAFRTDVGFASIWRRLVKALFGLKPEQGCETSVFCAINKALGSDPSSGGGEMYRFCKLYEEGTNFMDPEDPEVKQVFEMSKKLIGF